MKGVGRAAASHFAAVWFADAFHSAEMDRIRRAVEAADAEAAGRLSGLTRSSAEAKGAPGRAGGDLPDARQQCPRRSA
jgi:hypothetical protein